MIHRIDKYILTQLLSHDSCSFSELRLAGVESNTLTYRLKRFMKLGYVAKDNQGQYFITSDGRFFTDRLNLGKFVSRELPKPMSLLICRRGDEWLLHRRAIHPLRNMIGLPHANVHPGVPVIEAAEGRLRKTYGLTTTLRYRGCAYLTFYKDGQLEGYNQVNILENATSISGEVKPMPEERFGEYFWVKKPDFSQPEYIPSLQAIAEALENTNSIFFLDTVFHL